MSSARQVSSIQRCTTETGITGLADETYGMGWLMAGAGMGWGGGRALAFKT